MEMVVDSLVKNNEIPIVDITHMGRVVLPVRPWVKKAATHLVRGISEKGLVLIVNHGITEEKLQRGYKAMKKFCDLPEETRVQKVCANNTCANTNGNTNRMALEEIESSIERERLKGVDHKHGYVPPGTDRQARERMEEIRHTYNLTHFNEESEPNDEVPGFTDAVTVLANEFKRVAGILLQLLAVGLEMDPNFFLCKHQRMLNSLDSSRKNKMNEDDSINDNNNTNCVISNGINIGDEIRHENNRNNESVNETLLRIVYYPPLGDRMIPGMMRLSQRIECGSFTILAQDSEGGLEVFTNSKWHRVGHLPGALLINMGTLMEDWTTGRFKAMKYRVIIPEQKTIRSRGHFNIGLHVHPEDVIVPYPVVSSSTTQSEHCNSCNCENLRRASKWPLTLTILNAYHNMQTRIQRLRLRRLLRLLPRRFQRRNRSSSTATQNHTLANINNVNIVANNTVATVGEARL